MDFESTSSANSNTPASDIQVNRIYSPEQQILYHRGEGNASVFCIFLKFFRACERYSLNGRCISLRNLPYPKVNERRSPPANLQKLAGVKARDF